MPTHIRKAKIEDAAQLASLLRGIGWFGALKQQSPQETEQQVRHHLQLCLASGSHSLYIAEDEEGSICAYTAVHWLPYLFLPGPEGYVSELFVQEEARGQGLGARLLDTVKTEARQRGCWRLSLLNGKHRDSYRRGFYKKHGWEERPGMANFVYWLAEK